MATTKTQTNAQIKANHRAELREGRAVGKMTTGQIIGYLCYRHRAELLGIAFVVTNLLWMARVHPH